MENGIDVPAAPGNSNQMKVPARVFDDVKIVSLQFDSDHHIIKDNTGGWSNSGDLYPKPEYKAGGPCAPISHTKNSVLKGTLTFKVSPDDAPECECSIKTEAPWGTNTWSTKLKGGRCQLTISQQLTDITAVLKGDLNVTVDNGVDGPQSAGAVKGIIVYVTMDVPISLTGKDEEGITERRMRASCELVSASGSNVISTIAEYVMGIVKKYTLIEDKTLSMFNHPHYWSAAGGAWPIAEYADKLAECQAICRFARAVLAQVGCPGTYEIYAVWTQPDKDGGKTAVEAPLPSKGLEEWNAQNPHPKGWEAALVDRACVEGQLYDKWDPAKPDFVGFNNFEACLRVVSTGSTGTTTTRYYGGGIPGGYFGSPGEVVLAFHALVWASRTQNDKGEAKIRVEKIVRRYQG